VDAVGNSWDKQEDNNMENLENEMFMKGFE
jgi:hypothetical protein